MTRPSKREVERQLEELAPSSGSGPSKVELKDTVIGTGWDCSDASNAYTDLDPDETKTETAEVEL